MCHKKTKVRAKEEFEGNKLRSLTSNEENFKMETNV
jgi:hypothetical protein